VDKQLNQRAKWRILRGVGDGRAPSPQLRTEKQLVAWTKHVAEAL